ncbi:hypothetical protein AVO44_08340 [Ruegeria profundi]|uniref:Lnb N-terminal periplasmic domain-containing protein n=2 Tax=Ruegeria profundi TaxID=1685378 RepID=A0A0X3TU76_9RHOB|nr:hypothetical protein AVO44_08340 [Ruegeria profundi]
MLWGSLAIWFKVPGASWQKYTLIAIFLLPGFFALVHLYSRKTLLSLLVYLAGLGLVLIWWQTLQPPSEGDWAKELSRQVTGQIEGDILTLDNVRAFEWRTAEDYDQAWLRETYDLTKLETLDLFLSYWGDPRMAHFMLSFGFNDGEYLAWSIEVRRTKTGSYSPVADFFKANPLVILASKEFDVVGMRSNIWKNDVHIFRLDVPKERLKPLLEVYVADANHLAETPVWYNSIFTNCTTVMTRTTRALGIKIPHDWRIIVNGYLPEFLHEQGYLNANYTIEELRERGRIADRVAVSGLGKDYSRAAREGVPSP